MHIILFVSDCTSEERGLPFLTGIFSMFFFLELEVSEKNARRLSRCGAQTELIGGVPFRQILTLKSGQTRSYVVTLPTSSAIMEVRPYESK